MKKQKVLRMLSVLLSSVMMITSSGIPAMAQTPEEGAVFIAEEEVTDEAADAAEGEDLYQSESVEAADEVISPDGKGEITDDTGYIFKVLDENTAKITGYESPGYSEGSVSDLNIPGTVKDYDGKSYTVTEIGSQAFKDYKRFTGNLTIPDSVKNINDEAFFGCVNLKGSLIIPDSVTSIGFDAFRECYGMDGTLKIGKNVQIIWDRAFQGCSQLKGDITIPGSIKQIGQNAFYLCSGFTGHLIFEKGSSDYIDYIGKNAFSGLNITGGLDFPTEIGNIDPRAFYECKKLNGPLVFEKGVGFIGDYAFAGCEGLTGNLNLDYDDIFPQVTVRDNAFKNCKSLGPVLTLGNKTYWDNSMGMYSHSFIYCYGIKKVVNGSNTGFNLQGLNSSSSSDVKHSWKDESGKIVNEIANGTAYRDDYVPGKDDEDDDDNDDEDDAYMVTMKGECAVWFDEQLATKILMYEGEEVYIVWANEDEDTEFVKWESKNKSVVFKDPYSDVTSFTMPAEDVEISYVDRKKGSDPEPEPEPDPETRVCPNIVTKQKVDLSTADYFGAAFDKKDSWTVEPKTLGSVSKGIFTAKKPGEVTVTWKDKDKKVKGIAKFTIETPDINYPVNPKNGKKLSTMTYYRKGETIDVSTLISTTSGLTPVKYECSDKKGKNFVFDEKTNTLTVLNSGGCKITVYYNYGDNDKYAAKYPVSIKSSLPKLKGNINLKAGKSSNVAISNVQKDLEVTWGAFEMDENGDWIESDKLIVEEDARSNNRKCKITANGNAGDVICLTAFVGDEEDEYDCMVTIK